MDLRVSLFSFCLIAPLLLHCVRSDDTGTQLLKGLNSYRASLNLSSLASNTNAACLADQIAKQFKSQPCTNTTGSDTVPGTEQQFPNYPSFLSKCHINTTVTQDGQVLPACVPNLEQDLVLTNFTKTQYNEYLNSTEYVGVGIADEGNWVVVVLSTNSPTGNYAPGVEDMSEGKSVNFGRFGWFVMFVLLGFGALVVM
ncbi:hypothetical protein LUZ60_014099 [Juncus effusus]|nr:hypothetical protein LUZ60_014099 [Juncus effusus]